MSEEKERFFKEFEFPGNDDWKNAAISALKGASFDKVMYTKTYEGIELKPIYNKEDLENISHIRQDYPGFYPFNRGCKSSGYDAVKWELSQNIPYPMASEFNTALKNDLQKGQNSVRINMDRGAVLHEDFTADDLSGRDVCIAGLADLEIAFDGINLTEQPINVDAGIGAYPAFCCLAALAKSKNQLSDLHGSLNFDYITELAKEGILYDDSSSLINEMFSATKWSIENSSKFKTIGINAFDWHNSGGNAVQETAIALALGVYYIRELMKKGLSIDEIAPRMSFKMGIGINFFMEIAKFRAMRIIWSRVIKEFGGNEESQKIFIHAVTSEREHTKLDPYVNVLRATSQVFSAVTGACDSITVNSFDTEYGLPGEFSRRISRNIQNVIKYESHLNDTIDPAAGSYYIESLTNELMTAIWNEFLEFEKAGGIIDSLISGTIQEKIELNFKQRIENIALRKDIIVGVNKYANINEKSVETVLNFDFPKLEKFVKDFDAYISTRNNEQIDKILDKFESEFNSNPAAAFDTAVSALESGASLGELYNSIPMDEISIIEILPIMLRRSSEILEDLRDVADYYVQSGGLMPELDFVCFGQLRDWKPRADFSNDFFSVGGFANKIYDGINSAEDALAMIDFSEKKNIVVCSTDDMYSEVLVEFAEKVKQKSKENYIILAGYPKDKVEIYKNAGVDMFIHVKANIVDCLSQIYKVAGIIK